MKKPDSDRCFLTHSEAEKFGDHLAESWISAAIFVHGRIRGHCDLALRVTGVLAGWDERTYHHHRKSDPWQRVIRARFRTAAMRQIFGIAIFALLLIVGGLALSTEQLLTVVFPVGLLALFAWIGAQRGANGGGGWLMVGIPLIVVTLLVLAGTRGEDGLVPSYALPVWAFSVCSLALGAAQLGFEQSAPFSAAAPESVTASRWGHRITLFNITIQAATIQLAPYWMWVSHGGLAADDFNAAIRYTLVAPLLGAVIATTLAACAASLRRSIIALLLPPLWCLGHVILTQQGTYSYLLEWALVQVLTAFLAVPVRHGLNPPFGPRIAAFGAALAVVFFAALLAGGVILLMVAELMDIGALDGWKDVLLWLVTPAILATLDEALPSRR